MHRAATSLFDVSNHSKGPSQRRTQLLRHPMPPVVCVLSHAQPHSHWTRSSHSVTLTRAVPYLLPSAYPQALSKHAEERPTARQLLSHPWVRAHLNWEPPSDFIDPIPAIDYRYYQEAGDDDSDVDQDSTMVSARRHRQSFWKSLPELSGVNARATGSYLTARA